MSKKDEKVLIIGKNLFIFFLTYRYKRAEKCTGIYMYIGI